MGTATLAKEPSGLFTMLALMIEFCEVCVWPLFHCHCEASRQSAMRTSATLLLRISEKEKNLFTLELLTYLVARGERLKALASNSFAARVGDDD